MGQRCGAGKSGYYIMVSSSSSKGRISVVNMPSRHAMMLPAFPAKMADDLLVNKGDCKTGFMASVLMFSHTHTGWISRVKGEKSTRLLIPILQMHKLSASQG